MVLGGVKVGNVWVELGIFLAWGTSVVKEYGLKNKFTKLSP